MQTPTASDLFSVVIPTSCETARAPLLWRAIDSVLSQAGVAVELLVVINGGRRDEALAKTLAGEARIRTLSRAEGNVSAARHHGLLAAHGRYVCFLDDDDELLPGALATRLSLAQLHPHADVIVTNGLASTGGIDTLFVDPGRTTDIVRDPAGSLLRANWFSSAAGTFRTKSIEPSLFSLRLRYFEWTYLFFALQAADKRFHYHPAATYRCHFDTPDSASKSAAYDAAYPAFLRTLMRMQLPSDVLHVIHGKYQTALNTQSQAAMARGAMQSAWSLHGQCLLHGGWRYVPYTRRLLRHTLGSRI